MHWQVDWRRVAAGGAVLLLHLLFILALLTTTGVVPLRIGSPREIILTLTRPPHAKQTEPVPAVANQIPIPEVTYPTFVPRPITFPPPAPAQKSPEPQGDIRALGRYLFNCSGAYYEDMSEQEKAHCLANRWGGKKPEKAPVLDAVKPSPFDEVLIKRNQDFAPAFTPCDPSSINASLHNVPCTNFQNGHSILQEVPGQ